MLNLIDAAPSFCPFYDGYQISLLLEKWHCNFLQLQCFKGWRQICDLCGGHLAFQGAQPSLILHENAQLFGQIPQGCKSAASHDIQRSNWLIIFQSAVLDADIFQIKRHFYLKQKPRFLAVAVKQSE